MLIGIFYLIFGIAIALFGANLFPYIGPAMVALFTTTVVYSLTLAFGWMDTKEGCVISISAAVVLGIAVGSIIRRYIWLSIALTGLIAGFFSGTLIDAVIVVSSGWDPIWFYWLLSSTMGAIGCLAACFYDKELIMVSTAGVGSYLFMRSWTLFFPGHYPSEAELMSYSDFDAYDSYFWVFIAVFAICWPLSVIY